MVLSMPLLWTKTGTCKFRHEFSESNLPLYSRVFVWGYNGYCRLGLGNQVDALVPKPVPQFAGPNEASMASHVIAGPSNSVVIDKQGMYWMTGKWKNTGDGTSWPLHDKLS